MDAISLIQKHEGLRLKAYHDSRGIISIGYGRNLEGRGITGEEALMLLQRDYTDALNDALAYPWYQNLTIARQAVIVDMIYNLGRSRFAEFQRMMDAIEVGDYDRAAAEMLNSAWAAEVHDRAIEDAAIMKGGDFV